MHCTICWASQDSWEASGILQCKYCYNGTTRPPIIFLFLLQYHRYCTLKQTPAKLTCIWKGAKVYINLEGWMVCTEGRDFLIYGDVIAVPNPHHKRCSADYPCLLAMGKHTGIHSMWQLYIHGYLRASWTCCCSVLCCCHHPLVGHWLQRDV